MPPHPVNDCIPVREISFYLGFLGKSDSLRNVAGVGVHRVHDVREPVYLRNIERVIKRDSVEVPRDNFRVIAAEIGGYGTADACVGVVHDPCLYFPVFLYPYRFIAIAPDATCLFNDPSANTFVVSNNHRTPPRSITKSVETQETSIPDEATIRRGEPQ